jgi:hypothetical protein
MKGEAEGKTFVPVKEDTMINIERDIKNGAEIVEGCNSNGTLVSDLTPKQLRRCKNAYTSYTITLKKRLEDISTGTNQKGDMRAVLEIIKLRSSREETLETMVDTVLDALETVLPTAYYEVALKALRNLEV